MARYLDCGVWENGFARVRCHHCPQEFLVAFSCKGRGLCPSCGAKRAAELAAFLVPHVHALVTCGGWTAAGEWLPVPYVDEGVAEELFRHLEALVRYMMRSPVSLSRLRFSPGANEVVYTHKDGHDAAQAGRDKRIDAEDFVARILVQIPDPRRHVVRYYGAYSNRARGQRRKTGAQFEGNGSGDAPEPVPPSAGAGGPEAPLGQSDPASVRSGPARVSSVWRRDADHRFHH